MKTILPLSVIITCLLIVLSCNSRAKEFTEKRLVVASMETVKVPELDLSITNNGCGRKWIVNDSNQSYEKPYCELVFKRKDSTYFGGSDFEPVYIGNIKIVVDRMNPWGREEDSVPAGGCRLWISRVEGR